MGYSGQDPNFLWKGTALLPRKDLGRWCLRSNRHIPQAWSWCAPTFQRHDLPILLLSIPSWQCQCFFLSTLASGNPFLSLHMFHPLLLKIHGHLSWIPLNSRTAALLVSSISLCYPEKLNPGYLQSSLDSDLQRNIENPQRSQVTQYLLKSGRVVTKSLDSLLPQVHCING